MMKSSAGTKPAWISPGSKTNRLADLDNLPDPDDIATEIIENLEAGLESFKEILKALDQ